MYKKFVSALYALNIIFQSFFNLAFPIGISILISWLLVEKAGLWGWIYAPLVIVGVIFGFISMVKFILTAMKALERLESEREKNSKTKKEGTDVGK